MRKVVLSDASTSATAFEQRLEQDGFGVFPACLDEATVELLNKQFDDTAAILKEISYPFQVFGGLQYHGPCVKSWRPYLGQSALRSEGFSSIKLEAQIGKRFGTKI